MNTYFLYPFRFSIHYISLFTGASVLPHMYFSIAYYNALPLRLRLSFFPQCQQPQFILPALLCLFALPFSHSLIVTSFLSLPFMFDTIPKSIPLTLPLSQHIATPKLPPPLLSYYFRLFLRR